LYNVRRTFEIYRDFPIRSKLVTGLVRKIPQFRIRRTENSHEIKLSCQLKRCKARLWNRDNVVLYTLWIFWILNWFYSN